jgi:hypothetical protein
MRPQGPRASNFINIELSTPLATDATLNAADACEKAMKPEGQAYIDNERFSCSARHQDGTQRGLKDVANTHVFIGRGQDEVEDAAHDMDTTSAQAINKLI